MIVRNLTTALVAVALSMTVAACGNSEAPVPEADAAPAPIPAEAAEATSAATTAAVVVDEGSRAMLNMLTPHEKGMALLSCVRPIDSAKPNKHLFDADLVAQLEATDYLSHVKIIGSMDGMTIKEARAIMDASPSFVSNATPSASDITGLKQCLVLAAYHASEQAKSH